MAPQKENMEPIIQYHNLSSSTETQLPDIDKLESERNLPNREFDNIILMRKSGSDMTHNIQHSCEAIGFQNFVS